MDNKKILILSSCYNNVGANSICVRNLTAEMLKRGYDIFLLSDLEEGFKENEIDNNVKVQRIKAPLYTNFSKNFSQKEDFISKAVYRTISFLRRVMVTFFYPNVAPFRAKKVYKAAMNIIESEKIDTVLGVYRSYESIYASMKIKEKSEDKIKVITYHLDLLLSSSDSNKFIRTYKLHRATRYIEKELSLMDRIIVPESAEKWVKDKDNVFSVDFPLYITDKNIVDSEFIFPEDTINITFVGTLDAKNRNPEYIINFINDFNASNERKASIHIWGKIVDNSVYELINKNSCVSYHSEINNKYVDDILSKSDFLLNISNKITYKMIPSKIFQLFLAKRPIINIVQHPEDASLKYFENNDGVLNITNYLENKEAPKEAFDFINSKVGTSLTVDDEKFIKSTPEYTIDILTM